MHFGIVTGTVVASQKVKDLVGITMKVVVPTDERGNSCGDAQVMVDSIGTRNGDLVMWVSKREASLAISGAPLANNYPVDAAITGIVDAVG